MPLIRWGWPILLWELAVLGWALVLLPGGVRWPVAGVLVLVVLFTIQFFRNPARTPQGGPMAVIASADGVVADITELDEPEVIGGPAVRIGVFMNVFNVHVNRFPIAGTVCFLIHRPGRFLDVRKAEAHAANEHLLLGLNVDPALRPGLKIAVKQIAGLIARRIVCAVGLDQVCRQGEVYGMIRFGSRVETWLPLGAATLKVQVGDRVFSGQTVLAELLPAAGATHA